LIGFIEFVEFVGLVELKDRFRRQAMGSFRKRSTRQMTLALKTFFDPMNSTNDSSPCTGFQPNRPNELNKPNKPFFQF
jgi:hypothetical protein